MITASGSAITGFQNIFWHNVYKPMLDLEENQKLNVVPSFFKCLPSKFSDHSSDITWRSIPVVVLDITGSSLLDML